MPDSSDRVIVVGAGPVGLVAAASLLSEGIPVLQLERTSDLAEDLRASTFHPPTLDMLDRFGVTSGLVERGLICPHWQFRDRRDGVIATFDLGRLEGETAHPYRLQCEQWKLTTALRALIDGHPDGTLVTDTQVESVAQDETGVTVTGTRPDGSQESHRGRYLIGADGARSVVRRAIGASFEGLTIPEIFLSLSTSFRYDEAIADLANIAYVSDPEEWLVLLRTPSLWRVLLPTDPNQDDAEILDPDAVEARLQAVQPADTPYDVVHKTAYRVHERVADKYIEGRIFLAGDAAHINNPLGGMGMNGGIHDAVNLTEKLARVWQGAPLSMMARYERQRRKVALETVQAQALRNRQILNTRDPEARRTHHDELRATVEDPTRHKAYVLRSSMIQSLRDLETVA
ncbi:MAG: NAD(P)/FAD-dependent oxidoreductase [Pseudomonadota bacterium]